MRSIRIVAALALLAAASPLATRPAAAQGGSGELRCSQQGSPGYFVTSDRKVTCVYYRPDGAVEFYTGAFHRIGIDIGPTNALQLAFQAQVPGPITTGALDGKFVGVGTQITLGHGLGADALVGGASGQAALAPIDNAYLTGFADNAGLGLLDLHYRGMERSRYR